MFPKAAIAIFILLPAGLAAAQSAQTIEKLALKASQESRRQYHSKRLKRYQQGKRYTSENSFFETTQFPMAEVDRIALPRTPNVPLAK